jgi:hypothetical protein
MLPVTYPVLGSARARQIVSTLRLIEISETQSPEGVLVTYRFELTGRRHEVWFRVSEGKAARSIEAFVALVLLPAMTASVDIVLDSGLSQQLRRNIETIQDVFTCWQSGLFRRISLQGTSPALPPNSGREVGCFFSGGVDSFYSLLKHNDEISTLILVHGFDIPLSDRVLALSVSHAVRDTAARLHKKVVEVHTNVRDFSNNYLHWSMYHGSALSAIGLLLSQQFATIYIPASHTYCDLMPWGSHPLIDPLWSTEQLTFVHDGCEATRVAKVAAISTSDVAMRNLRVCWRNPDGAYNCGRCDKCLRTMVNLYLAGALGQCATLPAKLDLKQIARTPIEKESARAFARENLLALRARGGDPELIDAIEKALDRRSHWRIRRIPRKARRWIRRKFGSGPRTRQQVLLDGAR